MSERSWRTPGGPTGSTACRMLGIVLAGTVLGGGAIGFALYQMRPSLSTGSGWTPIVWLGVGIIITTICMVLAIVAIVSKRLARGIV